jgi:hypothetical protein
MTGRRWGLAIAVVAVVLYLVVLYESTPAGGSAGCRLEAVFVVTDADTGDPVPGATVAVTAYERYEKAMTRVLSTDGRGRAWVFRDRNDYDWSYPRRGPFGWPPRLFREPVRSFDVSWGVVSVSTGGYEPVTDAWLTERRYRVVEKSFEGDWPFFRLEFNFPLRRRDQAHAPPGARAQ